MLQRACQRVELPPLHEQTEHVCGSFALTVSYSASRYSHGRSEWGAIRCFPAQALGNMDSLFGSVCIAYKYQHILET